MKCLTRISLTALHLLTLAALALSALLAAPSLALAASNNKAMYRLYNPNSGEHFYTSKAEERDNVIKAGWTDEGIGWIAPSTSNTPVYRLYSGTDHHYTTDKHERDELVKLGWKDEGIGWYSDDAKGVPLYRQYNPFVDPYAPSNNSGSHNYTTNKAENDALAKLGWKPEGIGWYGVKDSATTRQAQYDWVIRQYRACFTNGDYRTYYKDGTNTKYPCVAYEAGYNLSGSYTLNNLYYCYADLDSDGIKELLVGSGSAASGANSPSGDLIALYATEVSGIPSDELEYITNLGPNFYRVFENAKRTYYSLRANNRIYSGGSGGMYVLGYQVSSYNKGALTGLEGISCDRLDKTKQIKLERYVNGKVVETKYERIPSGNSDSETLNTWSSNLKAKYPLETTTTWTPITK